MAANQVQSIVKAFRLLDCFAQAKHPLSLHELSQLTGWPKSSIHGQLCALRECGAVEQSAADGKYRLGMRLFELGSVVSSGWDVIAAGMPHMQDIAFGSGKSAYIATLSGGESLVLGAAEAAGALRVVAEKGARMPLHATGPGKVLLAFLSPAECRRILAETNLQAFTPHTITDMRQMNQELAHIRALGYAIENGEYHIGLRGVAAPIYDVDGQARFALGASGMIRWVSGEEMQELQERVCRGAEAISHALGYRPK